MSKQGPGMTALPERFLAKFVKHESGCWLWIGGKNHYGYGRYAIRRGPDDWFSAQAHRVAYETLVGPIPEGLTLDHLCRVRNCVNPDHLEPVTRGENVLRGNGPSAQAARSMYCKRGHPLFGENLSSYTRSRICKTCHREQSLRRYHERKLEAA